VFLGGVALGTAARRWRHATDRLRDRVLGGPAGGPGTPPDALEALPAPVIRYFRLVLPDGPPSIRAARLAQVGDFRVRPSADPAVGWRPFRATQVIGLEPPGFVGDARIRMAPLVDIRVRDAYVSGRASMAGSLLAVVPVVVASDRAELREGALQRYLAEAVWLPPALLPRPGLVWTARDDSHARATLTDAGTSVSLDFTFAPSGEIVEAFAAGRLRAVRDGYERQPWVGRYRGYDARGGIRLPLESEVSWVVEGRERPYYRGRIVRIDFDRGAGA
jgi:hypothetical protein